LASLSTPNPIKSAHHLRSKIRQVPSHQEVFLSPTTLTSIIVEINARLPESDTTAPNTHFADPVNPPDTASVTSTTKVTLAAPSLSTCPAYLVLGSIISYDHVRSALPESILASVGFEVKSCLLLVRIEAEETDLCVRLNMPMKEFNEDEAAREEVFAKEVMERVVESLDVRDWSLFVN
jgi:Ran-interacting Mog1 protein